MARRLTKPYKRASGSAGVQEPVEASGSVRSYSVVPPTVVVEKWLSTHELISLDLAEPPTPARRRSRRR